MIEQPLRQNTELQISFKYIANSVGESIEPNLTPNSILNVAEYKPFHLIHVTQSENKLTITFNKGTGICLFISFIYKAW